MVVVVYEILNPDETVKVEDDGRYLLILGHVQFLSGTVAATLLILILIPYFGWFLLVIWTMFLVKIACYWDKPFYNFNMFKIKNQNTTNREGGQEAQRPSVYQASGRVSNLFVILKTYFNLTPESQGLLV